MSQYSKNGHRIGTDRLTNLILVYHEEQERKRKFYACAKKRGTPVILLIEFNLLESGLGVPTLTAYNYRTGSLLE